MTEPFEDQGSELHDARYYARKFREAIKEHSRSGKYREAIMEFSDLVKIKRYDEPTKCICTHLIFERCIVRSKITGKRLTIGNKCIKRFFPKWLAKQVDDITKERKRTTVNCKGCGKRVKKSTGQVYCPRCLATHKSCERCTGRFCDGDMIRRGGIRVCHSCDSKLPPCASETCPNKVAVFGGTCDEHSRCPTCKRVFALTDSGVFQTGHSYREICPDCVDALPECAVDACATKARNGRTCDRHNECTKCKRIFCGDRGQTCDPCALVIKQITCPCGRRKSASFRFCYHCPVYMHECAHGCGQYIDKNYTLCYLHRRQSLSGSCRICSKPIDGSYSVCYEHRYCG